VNPFYTLHVADTLHKALCMRSKERTQRLHRDLPFVANHPSAKWTTYILRDLEQLKVGQLYTYTYTCQAAS
jgi:trehalose-6-phosphate synthase